MLNFKNKKERVTFWQKIGSIPLLAFILVIAFFGAILAIFMATLQEDYTNVSLLSTIVVFLFTALFSWWTTQNQQRASSNREMIKLTNFSARRLEVLCSNINALEAYVRTLQSQSRESSRDYQFIRLFLENIAADTQISAKEIQELPEDYQHIENQSVEGTEDLEVVEGIKYPRRKVGASFEERVQKYSRTSKEILGKSNEVAGDFLVVSYNCLLCDHKNGCQIMNSVG